MLVLSRKLMEQIQIGENITVTVVHVKGKVVKLGIDAPRNIRVMRTELLSDGEDDAGGTEVCHGRLARRCQSGTRRGAWANRRTRGGTGSVAID